MAPAHICALGSSFAAGPGITPYADQKARRSSKNYAHLLAGRLDARLTDLTVSGATLTNVLDEPQSSMLFRYHFPPQLQALPSDADVVTLTAGGNDLGYIGGMILDSVRASTLGRMIMPAATSSVGMDAQQLADRFVAVIDVIKGKAPNARILLVEYMTLLGSQTKAGIDVAFDQNRLQFYHQVAETLNEAYRIAGQMRPDVVVVPVAKKSSEHALGSETPWVDPFSIVDMLTGKSCLHPNLQGMQAVADLLYEILKDA